MQSTKPPSGTRDFLPEDVRRREYVIGTVRRVYERYGYEPLETPAFENIETLLGKYGEEGNKLIFKILKRGEQEQSGEADLALRYDLTVPLARVVAQYQNELPKFFKRYQIQPVWRADRPAKGRFREFFQCDIDSIGSTSPVVEVEQLAAVSEVLATLGFSDFRVRLNHRQELPKLLGQYFGIIDPPKQAEALITLDKLDKIGVEGVSDELAKRGLTDGARALQGLKEAVAHPVPETLAQMIELGRGTAAEGKVAFDPFLARGLSYYTGAIMEIAVPDLAGSLGGGGRYDNLVGMFLGRDVPACGFSLGLERIIVVMSEREMFPPALVSSPADVMATIWNEESIGESIALATELRGRGLRVDVYPEADKMGKQFKYAASRGIPFVAIIGDDERAKGEIAIKDMRSGEQQNVKRNDVATTIQNPNASG